MPNFSLIREVRKEDFVLPGPSMKPTAWQALVLAMALVRSVREVAPAIYDRTTATFPSKKKTIPSKCSRKYQVYIVKLLSDIYFRGLFLIMQANESQIPSSISTEQHNYTVLLQTTTGHPFALLNIKLSLT